MGARVEAGRKAEEQMAFYLRRNFVRTSNVHVLHDIRVVHNDEVAQMDHLVVHQFGITIIESKSVSAAVRVNSRDEWERQHGKDWRGMPSPVLQARRQGLVLKQLLLHNQSDLLGPVALGLGQSTFGAMALDVFVAISDNGRVIRQMPDVAPEAIKADQVPERIQRLIAEYRRMNLSLINFAALAKGPRSFSAKETSTIAAFLRAKDAPRGETRERIEAFEASTPAVVSCRACGGTRTIKWTRKTSYFFSCDACAEDEVIRAFCPKCSNKARISKEGPDYSIACSNCDVRMPYLTTRA